MPPVHVITHPSFLAHDPGPGHPESAERLRAVLGELKAAHLEPFVVWREANAASWDELTRVHPSPHLRRLDAFCASGGGGLDSDTRVSRMSFEAAVLAAGAAVAASRIVLSGEPAFAAVRPPGHHATAETAMGFCLINNVVVAARAALAEPGVSRVLIVDWDVHHGNGTQDLVWHEERIRYVSLHQSPWYPGTGRADETGVGNIFNVPRAPGLPREAYVNDLDDAVRRAVNDWRPDVILVSAGFDAMAGDPLGGFTLEPDDYAEWIARWRTLGAPIGAVLEGGYAPPRVAAGVARVIRALSV